MGEQSSAVRTIVYPATMPGPIWHGVIQTTDGYYRRIVAPDHVCESGQMARETGWYQEGAPLTYPEALRLLAEAAWDDEADRAEELAREYLEGLGYRAQ